MSDVAEVRRNAVHSAINGVVYALDDTFGLTEQQQSEIRDALTDFAGSILDLTRLETALR